MAGGGLAWYQIPPRGIRTIAKFIGRNEFLWYANRHTYTSSKTLYRLFVEFGITE
jgi:hypothetical protein